MPSTPIPVDHTAWVEILPASETAFATLETHVPICFVRSATQPALGRTDGTHVNIHDVIVASSTEPTWAIGKSNVKAAEVEQHDE